MPEECGNALISAGEDRGDLVGAHVHGDRQHSRHEENRDESHDQQTRDVGASTLYPDGSDGSYEAGVDPQQSNDREDVEDCDSLEDPPGALGTHTAAQHHHECEVQAGKSDRAHEV